MLRLSVVSQQKVIHVHFQQIDFEVKDLCWVSHVVQFSCECVRRGHFAVHRASCSSMKTCTGHCHDDDGVYC